MPAPTDLPPSIQADKLARSQERIAKAAALANLGLGNEGISLLRPLVAEKDKWPGALAAMGYCFEKSGKLATAIYLYRNAIIRQPANMDWLGMLENAEKISAERHQAVRMIKPSSWLIARASLLAIGAVAVAAVLAVDEIAGFKTIDYLWWIWSVTGVLVLLSLWSLVSWTVKLKNYGRALRELKKEDLSGGRKCPICGLTHRRGIRECPFCETPGKASGRPRRGTPVAPGHPVSLWPARIPALVILGLVLFPIMTTIPAASNVLKYANDPHAPKTALIYFLPTTKQAYLVFFTGLAMLRFLTLVPSVGLLMRLDSAWIGMLAFKLVFIFHGLLYQFGFMVASRHRNFNLQTSSIMLPFLTLSADFSVVVLLLIFRRMMLERILPPPVPDGPDAPPPLGRGLIGSRQRKSRENRY